MNNNIVFRRILAFMIDMFIVGLISSIILSGRDNRVNDKQSKELIKTMNDFTSEKITNEEYIDKYSSIIYEINQDNFDENLIYLIISVGYFLVFQYLNKGSSIGKKLMKIKIVSNKKKDVSLCQLLIRVCLINEVLPMIILLLLVKLSGGISFFMGYGMVSLIENIIIIIFELTLIFNKNNIALHDKISNSQVIYDK